MRHAYGIVTAPAGGSAHLAARVGDEAVDLRGVAAVPDDVADADDLHPLLALGRSGWDDVHGASPITLDDGTTRCWLEDGDTVTLTGSWRSGDTPVPLPEVTATVAPVQEVR